MSDQFLVKTAAACAAARCVDRTLKRWAQRGLIPAPVRKNSRCLLWSLSAIQAVSRNRTAKEGRARDATA
jgi:predicted site-specific integrase-resolvase